MPVCSKQEEGQKSVEMAKEQQRTEEEYQGVNGLETVEEGTCRAVGEQEGNGPPVGWGYLQITVTVIGHSTVSAE